MSVTLKLLIAYRYFADKEGLQSTAVRLANATRKRSELLGLQTVYARQALAIRQISNDLGLIATQTVQLIGNGLYELTRADLVAGQTNIIRQLSVGRLAQDGLGLIAQYARQASASRTRLDNLGLQTFRTILKIGAGVYAIQRTSYAGLNTSFVRYNPIAYRLKTEQAALQLTYARKSDAIRTLSNTAGLISDALAVLVGGGIYSLNPADIVGVSSAFTKTALSQRLAANNLGLQTVISRNADANRLTTALMALQTMALKQTLLLRKLTSNLGLASQLSRQTVVSRSQIASTLGLQTASTRQLNVTRSYTANVVLQSTYNRVADAYRLTSNSAAILDARLLVATTLYTFQRSLTDTLGVIANMVSRQAQGNREVSNSTGLQSAYKNLLNSLRALSSNAGAFSQYERQTAAVRKRSDNLGLQTIAYRPAVDRALKFTNTLGAQSSYACQINYTRTKLDITGIQTNTQRQIDAKRKASTLTALSTEWKRLSNQSRITTTSIALVTDYRKLASVAKLVTNTLGLQTQSFKSQVVGRLASNNVGLQTTQKRVVEYGRSIESLITGWTFAGSKSPPILRGIQDYLGVRTTQRRKANGLRLQQTNVGIQTQVLRQAVSHRKLSNLLGLLTAVEPMIVGSGVYVIRKTERVGHQTVIARQNPVASRVYTENVGLQTDPKRAATSIRTRQDILGVQSVYQRYQFFIRRFSNSLAVLHTQQRVAGASRRTSNFTAVLTQTARQTESYRMWAEVAGLQTRAIKGLQVLRRVRDTVNIIATYFDSKRHLRTVTTFLSGDATLFRISDASRQLANTLGLQTQATRAHFPTLNRFVQNGVALYTLAIKTTGFNRKPDSILALSSSLRRLADSNRKTEHLVGQSTRVTENLIAVRKLLDSGALQTSQRRFVSIYRLATQGVGLQTTQKRIASALRRVLNLTGSATQVQRIAPVTRLRTNNLGLTTQTRKAQYFGRKAMVVLGAITALRKSQHYGKLIQQTTGLQTQFAKAQRFGRVLVNTIGLTTVLSRATQIYRRKSETAGLQSFKIKENYTVFDRHFGNFIGTQTQTARQADVRRRDIDLIEGRTTPRRAQEAFRIAQDDTGLQTRARKAAQVLRSLTESVALSTAQGYTSTFYRTTRDRVGAEEAWSRLAYLNRIVSDTAGQTTRAQKSRWWGRVFSADIALATTSAKAIQWGRQATSDVGLQTAFVYTAHRSIYANALAGTQTRAEKLRGLGIHAAAVVAALDEVVRRVDFARNPSSQVTLDDQTARLADIRRKIKNIVPMVTVRKLNLIRAFIETIVDPTNTNRSRLSLGDTKSRRIIILSPKKDS